jgi:uncharacterized protein with von Willebrand factor type A (vWA) domain
MEQNNTPNIDTSQPEKVLGASRDRNLDFGKKTLDTSAITPEQGAPKTQPEQVRKARAENFLRRHGKMLSLFSKDSSLRFEPQESIDTFAFDAKDFKVLVPLGWFNDERYSEEELEFANYHERAHFIDMRTNPEAYLKNFEQMEKDAESLAVKYCKSHPGGMTKEAAKQYFYREIHTLFNCLDDIYVNDLVTSRVPFFSSGDGKKGVISLYKKLGFEDGDLTKQPLHSQMVFALLRDAMLGDELGQSKVDERVEGVLSQKVIGKSMRQLVSKELKTKNGITVDPAERYKLIRAFIQPSFLSLLEIDIQEQNDTQNNNSSNESHEGQGDAQNEDGSSGEPHEMFDSGDSRDEVIKDILKSMKEADDVKDMSPQERAKHQERKNQERFDAENDISEQERQMNELVRAKISKPRHEMRKFWQNLIGKSIEFRTVKVKNQRRGRLNVGSYIRKYPEIMEAEQNGNLREVEIYDRLGHERVVVDQPEAIDVTLLVDCSGSMGGSGEEVARETAALLMYSLKDFNTELDRTRSKTHSKLRASSQIIAFGSSFKEIKGFNRATSRAKSDTEIIKSISEIDSSLGGTDDEAPLTQIKNNISKEEKERMRSKKLKKIVFEITDGVSQTPKLTAQRLRELSREGVIVVGFQIGDISPEGRDTFEQIWSSKGSEGSDGQGPIGIYIGKEISVLPERLMKTLSGLLSNIVI